MKPLVSLLTLLILITGIAKAQPTVSNFAPTFGAPGMTITITGSGFSAASAVSIGAVAVPFTIVSNTQITVVLPVVASGDVRVTNPGGTGTRAGFRYVPTSGVITDFGGFWQTTAAAPTSTFPDNSHHLLAITHNDVTYSTGVNNSILTNNGVSYVPATFKALPVAAIAGLAPGSGSTYIALAAKVDGSGSSAYVPGVSAYTIKHALIDGKNGLDLGTGITNLPPSAIMTFQIYNIDASKAADAEPDIILTQIASPTSSNDVFTFLDAAGNPVGNSFTQDMTLLPKLGTYTLDLFTMAANVPYNTARPFNIAGSGTNTTREIRLVSLNLSDFGINVSNAGTVKALRITPSGNSDYAFIGYNTASVNLPPNAALSPETSVSSVCTGGTASLDIIGTAAAGGTLSYAWEESTNGGATWSAVANGGDYSGATTSRLRIANATVGYRYRAGVYETGNGNAGISGEFTINGPTGTLPASVSVSGGASTCTNTSLQLTSTLSGGSNLTYQWQSNAGGSYEDIPGANTSNYVPETNTTGTIDFRLRVSTGGGCPGLTSSATSVVVNGISSVTPAQRCAQGSITLNATSTTGSVSWYSTEIGGSALITNNAYVIPSLSATTTYYAAAAGCALRVPVVATVYPASAVGVITGGGSVAPGINTAILTVSSQTGNVVKWQSSTDNFNTIVNDIANTSSQLTVNNIGQNTQYRVVVQSGTCAPVTSGFEMITLPIRNKSLKLSERKGVVIVQWETYDQHGAVGYEVEKSTDSKHFLHAGTVLPNESGKYQWKDITPGSGTIFYRIREIKADASYSYSDVASVRLEILAAGIQVYPNPITGNAIHVYFNNIKGGKYDVQLYNAAGQLMHKGYLNLTAGSSMQTVKVTRNLNPGVYRLVVMDAFGSKMNVAVIVGQ